VTSFIEGLPDSKFELIVEPYKSHEEVLEDYRKAHILLLLVNDSNNARVNIPGKTFEYLAARKPIICMSQQGTDVWNILEPYSHVLLLEYSTPVEVLVKSLRKFIQSVKVEQFDSEKFSRLSLTGELVEVLESL